MVALLLHPAIQTAGLDGSPMPSPQLSPLYPRSPLFSPTSTKIGTPLMSPTTKVKSAAQGQVLGKINPTAPPKVSYAMLRQHHATALKYVIAKLRWEQTHNGYIPGHDAWVKHEIMIQKLEDELVDCENAKTLDPFPNAFAPIAFPKTHGPLTKEAFEKKEKEDRAKQKELDAKLDKQFPFIKQLFIGPRTKEQARNDKLLREQLVEGDLDDLEVLLPSENLELLDHMNKHGKPPPSGAPVKKPKPYHEVRMEKERAKVLARLKEEGIEPPRDMLVDPKDPKGDRRGSVKPRIGPDTKSQAEAAAAAAAAAPAQPLPVFGPKTKEEHELQVQREQRHIIMTWLRRPWSKFDPEVAEVMANLGNVAAKKLKEDPGPRRASVTPAKAIKEVKEEGKVDAKAEVKDDVRDKEKEKEKKA